MGNHGKHGGALGSVSNMLKRGQRERMRLRGIRWGSVVSLEDYDSDDGRTCVVRQAWLIMFSAAWNSIVSAPGTLLASSPC